MAEKQKETFFEKDQHHGLVKRIMLKKYVQAYIAKILNTEGLSIIIIDGFAGAGRIGEYGPDGWAMEIEKYGSALIILLSALQYLYRKSSQKERTQDAVDELVELTQKEWDDIHKDAVEELVEPERERDSRPQDGSNQQFDNFRLRLFFVEKEPKYYSRLVDGVVQYLHSFFRQINKDADMAETPMRITFNIKTVGKKTVIRIPHDDYPIECTIVNNEFCHFVPPKNTEEDGFVNSRRLTFLDPFGYTQTPMDHVKKYLDDDFSEVFINFMSSFVNRFVGQNPQAVANLYGIQLPADTPPNREALTDLGNIVRDIVRLHQNKALENGRNCSRSYIKYMKMHTGAIYAAMFEMRGAGKMKGKRSNDPPVYRDRLIYHMIHFSNHHKGLEAMKESMNSCSQYEGTFKMSDYKVTVEGIPLHIGNSQKDWVVANYVFDEFRSQKVDLKEVEEFVWEHTPFVFRKGILKILETEYQPRLTNVVNFYAGLGKRRKGTFPDRGVWRLTFRRLDKAKKWRECGDTDSEHLEQDESSVADKVFEEFQSQDDVPLEDIQRFVQGPLGFKEFKKILAIFEEEDGPNPRLIGINDANRSNKPRRKGTYPGWGDWRFMFRPKEDTSDEPHEGASSSGAAGEFELQAGSAGVQTGLRGECASGDTF